MKNFTFEIHDYAPELNKVFCNGVDVTRAYPKCKFTRDYKSNLQKIRIVNYCARFEDTRLYKLTATRPDGSQEVRTCAKQTIGEIWDQFKQAKAHYNIPGTVLSFKRYF